MSFNPVFIVGGIIAAAILSVLVDYLLKKLLPEKPKLPTVIAVLFFIVVLTAFIALPTLLINTIEYKGKIIDAKSNEPIQGARVKFESQTVSSSLIDTDSEGEYIFVISFTGNELTGRLRVETDKYEEYNRYITLLPDTNILDDIHLDPISETTNTPTPTVITTPTPGLTETLTSTNTPTPTPTSAKEETCNALVKASYTVLRSEPDQFSTYSITLEQNDCVNLLAITEDKEWVKVRYNSETSRTATGWLRIANINPKVSLDTLPEE